MDYEMIATAFMIYGMYALIVVLCYYGRPF